MISFWEVKKKSEKDYKGFVGNPEHYDLIGKTIFELLLNLGLKKHHKLLDIGCGSLRIGKYIIKFLDDFNYYGIEPNQWLLKEPLKDKDIYNKHVNLSNDFDFDLQIFNEKFDFILANSIFIHAAQHQINKCLNEVKLVLKKDGKFIFNYFVGEENNKSLFWSYPEAIKYKKSYINLKNRISNLLQHLLK